MGALTPGQPWPNRYKALAMYWLEEQWNKPSRTDHYLMRIAQRVQQQWSKKPVNLSDQLVKFARKTRREKASQVDQIARSKSIWMSRLGIKKGPE